MSAVQGTITTEVPSWVAKTYAPVDQLDVEGFTAHLTDNVDFRFGNGPSTVGKDAVRDGLTQLFGAIRGMKHHFLEVWESGDDTLLVLDVDYTRLDGDVVKIPMLTRIHRSGQLADRMQIFGDISPAMPS
jgi:hypothetical protein